MLRDNLKDVNYFEEYINYQTERIKKFEALVGKVILEKGTEDRGALNGLYSLQNFYLDEIKAGYSAGLPISDTLNYFREFLNISFKFNKGLTYRLVLDSLSLSILLRVEQSEFDKLVELVKKDDPNDYIIDFLINSRYNWGKQSSDVKFETPYKALVDVITLAQTDKQRSVERLKQYLDKEWYQGHSDAGWYDSHKNKHNTYAGYWSWESGALVIVLGLDDSSLQDQQYYPYDMVH
ncbi:PoNe immunity protein domain-containing protein [Mucilaginibacter sp. KACC 22063]|uniref:PoNe immunity protein domain-containing protein n=1 Tax=Mucilaginibacter sp. KACC 22063 TaxID=3025666 RepID=UPI0023671ED9|nr:PoNe immunity protein domain-containing protein [Mucilaginibacter sp. KACC 22063]WDF54383.1 DUF1911 domain-containing protein [Mucilaginibacter sp. KACC 22063]